MAPPKIFVMSSAVAERADGRRPAGVVHAVRSALPLTHTTLCGQANGLYLFARLRFSDIDDGSCPTCSKLAARPDGQMALPGL